MKKIFLIVLILVLTSCTFYKIENLVQENKYIYKVKLPEFWKISQNSNKYKNIMISAFGEEFDKTLDGNYIFHSAIISKKNFDGAIYVYVLNKNDKVYKDLANNSKVIFLDLLNKEINTKLLYSKIILNWKKHKNILKVAIYINKNQIILFDLRSPMFSVVSNYSNNGLENRNYNDYTEKTRKKILREYCKIINSLTREKIDNINNNIDNNINNKNNI